jgi:hypothetical protein
MAVSKPFTVKEGQTVQFLWEFFNTISHPQFADPGLADPGLKGAVETLGQITPSIRELPCDSIGTAVFVL